jgi:Fe-S cluster biogenesis protein NfuA
MSPSLKSGGAAHVALWDAINALVEVSGGRNSVSTARMSAVAKVESALRAALAEAEKAEQRRELSDEEIEAIRARWCGTGGTYRELVDAFMRAAGGEG